MNIQQKIQRQIEKRNNEISKLQGDIAEKNAQLVELKGIITGFEESLNLLPKEVIEDSFETHVRKLRPNSDVKAAYEFLCAEGEERHIDDIIVGIGKENTKKTKQALAGQLSYNYREGRIFTRPIPNTFGLIKWPQGVQNTDDYIDDDPFKLPDDFGDE